MFTIITSVCALRLIEFGSAHILGLRGTFLHGMPFYSAGLGVAIKRSWDMERCYYYGTMVAFWCFFTAMVLYYYGMNCRLKNAAFTAMNSTLLHLLSKGDGI